MVEILINEFSCNFGYALDADLQLTILKRPLLLQITPCDWSLRNPADISPHRHKENRPIELRTRELILTFNSSERQINANQEQFVTTENVKTKAMKPSFIPDLHHLLLVSAFASAFAVPKTILAQIDQDAIISAYNPDVDDNEYIGTIDLLSILSIYGDDFLAPQITINGQNLASYIQNLQSTIDSLTETSAIQGMSEIPIGSILHTVTTSPPQGWLLCDGRDVSIEDYPELYAAIGTTFGPGDSAFWSQVNFPPTTFTIPDFRGRTLVGQDNMGGDAAGVLNSNPWIIGQVGGSEMHQLTIAEMPEHSHSVAPGVIGSGGGQQLQYGSGSGINLNYSISGQTQSSEVGSNQAYSLMQPYAVSNMMIKAKHQTELVDSIFSIIDTQQEQISQLTEELVSGRYNLECTEMGVHSLCSEGSGFSTTLDSPDGYNFSLSSQGISTVTTSLVQPTWRKFEVSGIPENMDTVVIRIKYDQQNSTGFSTGTAVITCPVSQNKAYFFVYADTNLNGQGGSNDNYCTYLSSDFSNEPAFKAYSSTVGGCYCSTTRSHYELYLMLDGRYKDTGIRFNVVVNN